MSDDTTDRELPTAPKDTNPMLERILEEFRALRGLPDHVAAIQAQVATIDAKLDTASATADRIERLLVDTRADFKRSSLTDTELLHARIDRLEAELKALKDANRLQ